MAMKIVPIGIDHSQSNGSVGHFLQTIGYVIYKDQIGNLYAIIEQTKYLPLANVTSSFELENIPREWELVRL